MGVKSVPLPAGRTIDQLRNHYEVESALATRLKQASRAERREVYATMYDKLFAAVPDHPRLQMRDDPALARESNAVKWDLVRESVNPGTVFVEFAPGTCEFAFEMCEQVLSVCGIDISDQTGDRQIPPNFELVLYDGWNLDIGREFADIVFSDQLLEHLHPDDVTHHFELVRNMLKPGGRYIMRTPHSHSGPHDISMYFSEEPSGFHLKEWTHEELSEILDLVGFRSWSPHRVVRGTMVSLPRDLVLRTERRLGAMPHDRRHRLARRIYNNITLVITK